VISQYRPPDLYLPLNTNNWSQHAIDPGINELEIWAMSFYDEISLRNPDGLMNGKSMASTIKRCIPAIKNPWLIPENDYRYIAIGLNLATNGNKTNIAIKCDHCKERNEYEVDLQRMLDEHNHHEEKNFSIDDLNFFLGDATYQDAVTYRNNNYGLLKSISTIQKRPESSFNIEQLQNELHKYRSNEVWIKSRRIKKIEINGIDTINDAEQIKSVLESFNKEITKEIDKNLNFVKTNQIKKLQCANCNHVNTVSINIDPSDQFFNQLVNVSDGEIEMLFNEMDKEVKQIHREIARLVWFMRGSVSYAECMSMSPIERNSLNEQIKENFDTMKKNKYQISLI
jgi:hypothetical protein